MDQVHSEVLQKYLPVGGESLEVSVTLQLTKAKGVGVVERVSTGHLLRWRARDQMRHPFWGTVKNRCYDFSRSLRTDDIPKCVLGIALGARADSRCTKTFKTSA